ncbi:hypothetical protein, partial [Micromonospora sp. NPDC005087]|uniref:hypothetical protein n=1 Tax=Micromonospora sp. NPDC005087 TaxID=3364225 RepID=UPI0036A3A88C
MALQHRVAEDLQVQALTSGAAGRGWRIASSGLSRDARLGRRSVGCRRQWLVVSWLRPGLADHCEQVGGSRRVED